MLAESKQSKTLDGDGSKRETERKDDQVSKDVRRPICSEAKLVVPTMPEALPVQEERKSVMEQLEDFFLDNPQMTTAIGDFFTTNLASVSADLIRDVQEEQSVELHEMYLRYCDLIERALERFLEKRNISNEMFLEACTETHNQGNSMCHASLDYLMATIEYSAFVKLAQDFAHIDGGP